jgi:hypothetical protein
VPVLCPNHGCCLGVLLGIRKRIRETQRILVQPAQQALVLLVVKAVLSWPNLTTGFGGEIPIIGKALFARMQGMEGMRFFAGLCPGLTRRRVGWPVMDTDEKRVISRTGQASL